MNDMIYFSSSVNLLIYILIAQKLKFGLDKIKFIVLRVGEKKVGHTTDDPVYDHDHIYIYNTLQLGIMQL